MGQRQEQVIQRGNMNNLHAKIPSVIRKIKIKTIMRPYVKNLKIS